MRKRIKSKVGDLRRWALMKLIGDRFIIANACVNIPQGWDGVRIATSGALIWKCSIGGDDGTNTVLVDVDQSILPPPHKRRWRG